MIDSLSNKDILLVQHVKRWHMIRMRDEQNVAAHSYNVAMLLMRMLRILGRELDISAEEQLRVIEWALCHDVHEIEHGDVPSPSKVDSDDVEAQFWAARGIKAEPGLESRNFVVLMDRVEAYIYFVNHGRDGMQNGQPISAYLRQRVYDMLDYYASPVQDYVRNLMHDGENVYF